MIQELVEKLAVAFNELFPKVRLDVARCGAAHVSEVMNFIEDHWKHGHIMAHDLPLVDFMHKSSDGNYNFILGKKACDGDVVGVLGYIPTSQYDLSLCDEKDCWLAIWKGIAEPGSGLKLLEPIAGEADTMAAIGINRHVAKVYRWLGFDVMRLKQLYLLNAALTGFSIARVGRIGPACLREDRADVRLVPVADRELENVMIETGWRPRKTARYVVNRYLRHPIYRYQVWCACIDGVVKKDCVFVTRKISVGTASCLRVVDIVGDLNGLSNLRFAWSSLLAEEGAEFVDCMEYGLSESEEQILGMEVLDPQGDVVIPNYFEPFLQENIVITAAVMNPSNKRYVIFKGDSDQDRPSERTIK